MHNKCMGLYGNFSIISAFNLFFELLLNFPLTTVFGLACRHGRAGEIFSCEHSHKKFSRHLEFFMQSGRKKILLRGRIGDGVGVEWGEENLLPHPSPSNVAVLWRSQGCSANSPVLILHRLTWRSYGGRKVVALIRPNKTPALQAVWPHFKHREEF